MRNPDTAELMYVTIGTPLKDAERSIILETLKANNGNKTHTANALKIGLRTLQRKIKQYNQQGFINASHECKIRG